jgi:hypothetical protein
VLRLIAVCFVLIATALPLRAQEQQPDYSSNADAYLTDIQARFPEKPDTLEARAMRLDGDAAAERGAWGKAVAAYERAIAFGADDFETWMGLTRALRETRETGSAIAAAFSVLWGPAGVTFAMGKQAPKLHLRQLTDDASVEGQPVGGEGVADNGHDRALTHRLSLAPRAGYYRAGRDPRPPANGAAVR